VAESPRIDELRRRLEREPGSRIFAQLAEELRKVGQLPEAIRVARQGLLNHPGYPSARMTLGRALLDSRDLRGARSEFEAVLRGAPDNILASRYLADCLDGLGDLGSALLQYRATLRLAPGDRNLEAQIKALEDRLTPGQVAAVPQAPPLPVRRPEATRPGAIPVLDVDGPMELESALDRSPRWGEEARVPLAPGPGPVAPAPPAVTAPSMDESPVVALPAVPAPAWQPGADDTVIPPLPPPSPAFAEPEPVPFAPVAPPPPPPAEEVEFPAPPSPTALPVPAAAPAAEAQPLYSSTLAELYFQQGFTRQAIDVYEQLLAREPGNERLRARLTELEAYDRQEAGSTVSAPPPPPAVDPKARRREAIGRTISRLETLLQATRRA
jgi:tetratricopeptide (TPR) repeat protein